MSNPEAMPRSNPKCEVTFSNDFDRSIKLTIEFSTDSQLVYMIVPPSARGLKLSLDAEVAKKLANQLLKYASECDTVKAEAVVAAKLKPKPDPAWLSDKRIREIKHGEEYSDSEVLALAGEVREYRRMMKSSTMKDPGIPPWPN